jgi:hypothetical protein
MSRAGLAVGSIPSKSAVSVAEDTAGLAWVTGLASGLGIAKTVSYTGHPDRPGYRRNLKKITGEAHVDQAFFSMWVGDWWIWVKTKHDTGLWVELSMLYSEGTTLAVGRQGKVYPGELG